MLGFELPLGIKLVNPVPVDAWSGPYISITEALMTIPKPIRFKTMEVRIIENGIGYKYWFKDGIEDSDLIIFGADESSARISGDTYLQSQIDTEILNRVSGDTLLNNAITSETQSRIDSDILLNNSITAETQNRIDSYNLLNNAITDETYNRTTGYTSLNNAITSETQNRIDSDIILNNAITSETQSRIDSDILLNNIITAETYNRTTGYTSLSNDITSETQNRIDSINLMNNSISAETQSRISEDTRIEGLIPTKTSDITNDGDGNNKFITIVDMPPQRFQNNITVSLTNNKTFGKYFNGEVIPASGRTFEEVLRMVAIEDVYPTYVSPTLSISASPVMSTYVEVGSTSNKNITINYNKNDAGNASSLTILKNSVFFSGNTNTNSYTANVNLTWTTGNTYISGICSYLSGSTKYITGGTIRLDDRTPLIRNVNAPQAADNNFTTSQIYSTGVYPVFYFKSNLPISIGNMVDAISGGTASKIVTDSNGTLFIPYNLSSQYLAVAYPATSTTKTAYYVTALDSGSINGVLPYVGASIVNSYSGYWNAVLYKIHISSIINNSAAEIQLKNV